MRGQRGDSEPVTERMFGRTAILVQLAGSMVAMLFAAGCAGPYCGPCGIPSVRGHEQRPFEVAPCAESCGSSPADAIGSLPAADCGKCKLLGHQCPWHARREHQWIPGSSLFQGGIEPPRPRFHPVPTQPAFAPRPDSPSAEGVSHAAYGASFGT